MKIEFPFDLSWHDYLIVSVIIWFIAILNLSIWNFLFGILFEHSIPDSDKILFATVLTAMSMLKNFRIKEKKR